MPMTIARADHVTVRVPFLSLQKLTAAYRHELLAACDEVLESGCFLNGPQLKALEDELSLRFPGMRAVGVGSGTQALQALLLAYDIGPGDEVVTTAASFYATAKAISMAGARPVFADVRPDDFNIDVTSVRAVLSARTKAIVAVHLYGRPADMPALREVSREAGILLLEDAAQAFGASVGGVAAGALGDGAALSFYPTKNLGALGDAGAVLVPGEDREDRVKAARFLGWDGCARDRFPLDGISGRMDELQAAVLRVRMAHVDRELRRRRELAERYRQNLPPSLLIPPAPVGAVDAHHLFVIRDPERDRVAAELRACGIETMVHYRYPLHRQPRYESGLALPEAERWAGSVLSLPLNAALTDDEQSTVISAVHKAVRTPPHGGG